MRMISSLRLLEAILPARCRIAASLPPLSDTVRDRPQLCTPEPIRLKEINSNHGLNSRKLGKKGSKCQELRRTTQNTQKVCLFFGIHVRIGQHLDRKSWVQNRAESGAPSINRSPCFSATPGCGTVVCIRNAARVQPVSSCFQLVLRLFLFIVAFTVSHNLRWLQTQMCGFRMDWVSFSTLTDGIRNGRKAFHHYVALNYIQSMWLSDN